jgi:hypothetical protein
MNYNILWILVPTIITVFFLVKHIIYLTKKLESCQEQIENNTGKVDLELATVHQIINELVKRPNYKFLFIVPHVKSNGQELNVEVHSANVSVRMALNILKSTYEGIINAGTEQHEDDDLGEFSDEED